MNAESILAIVPARGGSKGVPRKNLRTVAGVPLVLRTLRALRDVPQVGHIVCSTEDPEIAGVCRVQGFAVLDRPPELAGDHVTVAEVARHAVTAVGWNGDVGVFQPTSPLLSAQEIVRIVEAWRASDRDCAITVTPEPHLLWRNGTPLHERRTNRQDTDGTVVRETGAVQLARGNLIQLGVLVDDPLLVPIGDALDVDSHADLHAARLHLSRRHIAFRVLASERYGSGHLYRCLRLAEELAHHHITFSVAGDEWAAKFIALRGWAMNSWWPPDYGEDVVIFDTLDTGEAEVCEWKSRGSVVVTFEDEGPGARYADLTVNELLPPNGHARCGPRYAVLRPEFADLPPFDVHAMGTKVLVVFGGTDAANLTARVAAVLRREHHAQVRCIVGPGVPDHRLPHLPNIEVVRDVASMAAEMRAADLVVTSAGRTATECAAVGVPTITIAANERESRHHRLPGILHLGLWATLSDVQIGEAVSRVLCDRDLRAEMSATSRAQVDGKGVDRIVWRLEGLMGGLA